VAVRHINLYRMLKVGLYVFLGYEALTLRLRIGMVIISDLGVFMQCSLVWRLPPTTLFGHKDNSAIWHGGYVATTSTVSLG
jgi:hypothetical protein